MQTMSTSNLQLKTFVTGPLQVNCSLLYSLSSAQAVLVDPGGNMDSILDFLKNKHLYLAAILHTHGHFDHINGTQEFFAAFPESSIPTYMHEADTFLWQNFQSSAAMFGIELKKQSLRQVHYPLEDGQELIFQDISLQVLHTPGHSPGSVCFYLPQGAQKDEHSKIPLLLSGDTLFAGAIGRTDLWQGSHSSLLKSIHQKLYVLPYSTFVVPGHGENTSIGEEKHSNPFTKFWA